MKKVLKIDNEGFFIEDVILQDGETTPNDCIEIECPQGFYKPKWNGKEWTEGLTQNEINTIKDTIEKPTQIETLTKEIANIRVHNMKKDTIITSTLQTIANLKVEIMGLKGGNA
jgi:hypothetical protein